MLAQCPQQRELCFLLVGVGARWLHMPAEQAWVPHSTVHLQSPCSPSIHSPPPSPTWGVGVPQSYREFNPEARHWRGWGCQVNRPCRIQQAMEPRPPKEQPNGRLEGKAEAQITPTQRASHRVRPVRERHRVIEDALGSVILLQECRGGTLGEEPRVLLHLPLVEKFTLFCGWMGVSEPVVTSAWLCGSVSTTLACVCVCAHVRACACPHLRVAVIAYC